VTRAHLDKKELRGKALGWVCPGGRLGVSGKSRGLFAQKSLGGSYTNSKNVIQWNVKSDRGARKRDFRGIIGERGGIAAILRKNERNP